MTTVLPTLANQVTQLSMATNQTASVLETGLKSRGSTEKTTATASDSRPTSETLVTIATTNRPISITQDGQFSPSPSTVASISYDELAQAESSSFNKTGMGRHHYASMFLFLHFFLWGQAKLCDTCFQLATLCQHFYGWSCSFLYEAPDG